MRSRIERTGRADRLPAAAATATWLAAALSTLACLAVPAQARERAAAGRFEHVIRFTDGTFYGPAHMTDTPSPAGELSHLQVNEMLEGTIDFFNNGAAPPNIASEAAMQGTADGRSSNGRPLNEYLDGGVIQVGRGAMSFLNVTVGDGAGSGRARTFLDADLNWHLVVDLALDPGFPEGVIVIDQLDITSGITHVPWSMQTAAKQPGGTDRAGSLVSGSSLSGRLGDFDADGKLDGILVGVTTIPIAHIFLPGAPAVQVRSFTTGIAITPLEASLLATVSAMNLVAVMNEAAESSQPATDAGARAAGWSELALRLDGALRPLSRERRASRARGVLERVRGSLRACDDSASGAAANRSEREGESAPACAGKLAAWRVALSSARDQLAALTPLQRIERARASR